jgi:hypothetical protein
MLICIISFSLKAPFGQPGLARRPDRGCGEEFAKYMICIQASGGTTPTFHGKSATYVTTRLSPGTERR